MEQGVYTTLTNAQYHGGAEYSASQLHLVARAPALLQWSRHAPSDDSSIAARVGSALHMLILEPELFDQTYIVEPGKFDLRTSAGKLARAAFEAEAQGLTVLSSDDFDMLQAQRDSVMAHPEARALIEIPGGLFEASAYWTDPDTGLPCRCRPDWWPLPEVILDLKTTDDPTPHSFARSVHEYRYHVQDAFYTDGAGIAGGTPIEEFLFLAIGKRKELGRYPVRLYRLRDEDKAYGRELYKRDLQTILECEHAGVWSGIEDLSLPAYAYSR